MMSRRLTSVVLLLPLLLRGAVAMDDMNPPVDDTVYRNLLSPDYQVPLFRWQLWGSLGIFFQTAAQQMGYDMGKWEDPPFLDLERLAFSDLSDAQQDVAKSLGFTEDGWDCYINHYDGYDWEDLEEFKVIQPFLAFGWTEEAWDSDDEKDWPENDSLGWVDLPSELKQAAANHGHFRETWDNDQSIGQWVGTSTFLLSFVTPDPTPVPTAEPTPIPTAEPTSKADGFICFPGSALVTIKSQTEKVRMDQIKVGDEVLVENGIYERIYSFGHYSPMVRATFLQISTDNKALTMTSQHLLATRHRGIVPAGAIKLGDELVAAQQQYDGDSATIVTSIESVVRQGAYAPFTRSGKLVVDDFVVSSYYGFQQDSATLTISSPTLSFKTPITFHWLGHAFTLPHRLFCEHSPASCTSEQYSEDGISMWIAFPAKIVKWLFDEQLNYPGIFMIAMSIIIPVVSFLAVADIILHDQKKVTVVILLALMWFQRRRCKKLR